MAQLKILGKSNTSILTRIEITGMTDALNDEIGYCIRCYHRDGDVVTGEASKAQIQMIMNKIAELAPPPAPAPTAATQNGGYRTRRIELASRAGANSGRSWIADGYTIDKHSLPPEWEGARVCYVYEN